jgi:hypothetical protein
VLVLWVNQNVIIAIFDVKFGKQAFPFYFVQFGSCVWHIIFVRNGDIIELAIVHDHSEIISFFLGNKKDRRLEW